MRGVRRPRAEEYVARDHPDGELRLRLDRDGRFMLRLSVWDPIVRTVAGHREMHGRWRQRAGQLELSAARRQLVYRPQPGGSDVLPSRWKALLMPHRAQRARALIWERSNLPTFADGLTLTLDPS